MTELDIDQANEQLAGQQPGAILEWAWNHFNGSIVASSSFQTQSVPLLHLISRHTPDMPVLFLDTGFHFPETLAFRDELAREFELNLINLYPRLGHGGFRREYGDLHRRDPDLCCYLNKVEPLEEARRGYSAWLSGIRRDQTPERALTRLLNTHTDGRAKLSPLAEWTERDVWSYAHEHQLPEHPLLSSGYLSIGCAPCTRAISDGEDARAGRWSGLQKIECGLHTEN